MFVQRLITASLIASLSALIVPASASAHGSKVRNARTHRVSLTKVSSGKFLRWRLGTRFVANPRLFSGKQEPAFNYRFADKVRIAGRTADRVTFVTEQDPRSKSRSSRYLHSVELHFFVRGKTAAKKLQRWVNRRCARWVKQLHRRIPSPMRHRVYGPTFISKADCEGRIGRATVHVRERLSWGRRPAFYNGRVTIRVELARPRR